MERALLVAAALAPVIIGNAARALPSEPPAIAVFAVLLAFAVAGAFALRRLATSGVLAIAPSLATHVGQWRVAAALLAMLPIWLPGLRAPMAALLVAADIVFWSVVLLGARTRRLAMLAAVVYATARTSSLGALWTTHEETAASWLLVHRVGAVVGALLIVVVILRATMPTTARPTPTSAPTPDA